MSPVTAALFNHQFIRIMSFLMSIDGKIIKVEMFVPKTAHFTIFSISCVKNYMQSNPSYSKRVMNCHKLEIMCNWFSSIESHSFFSHCHFRKQTNSQ